MPCFRDIQEWVSLWSKGEGNPRQGAEMKDMDLLERIRRIKAEHPFWGYRRVWAWLRDREKEEG